MWSVKKNKNILHLRHNTRKMNKSYIRILFVALLFIVSASCNRKAQLLYMSDVQNDTLKSIVIPQYKLHPGDVLSINVFTQDERLSKLFNVNSGVNSYNMYNSEMSAYVNGYSISDSGLIKLPVIGAVNVEGLSVRQAQDYVQAKVDSYLNDGLVFLKLLSYKITLIGEVKRPGTYTNFKENLNIFEALGMAGDFSDYGERSNVLVLRRTADGTKTFRLNLHDKNILTSEGFYLLPNDTVIVEPRKGKIFNMNSPNISLFLSVISTTVLLLNFFK